MKIEVIEFGMFRLDGGAMFGSVPKNLWAKLISVDEENCIPLASRSLLITVEDKKILIDVGLGEKWDEKSKKIFGIKNTPRELLGFKDSEITDVILTHLHFDHGGGISRWISNDGTVERQYPNATIHIQKSNYERAKAPGLREKASYLPENVSVIDPSKDVLLAGNGVILEGKGWQISGYKIDGHTLGQQWIEIRLSNPLKGASVFMFATDLIPTSRHLPLPYHMGYDLCAEKVMDEKKLFLESAMKNDAVVVFQHDPDIAAGRVGINEKGHFALKEKFLF
jgi:glyoxylase-like metal-dependent hydrolase (beta-lactamase superfamily II)